MGTINYKTSEYITLALKPYDHDDFINDFDFNLCAAEYPDIPLETLAQQAIEEYYNDDYSNAESVLDKYDFIFFDLKIENGYYEGYSIRIENKFDNIYDYTDKQLALMETSKLKDCLDELNSIGYQACFPGWCPVYFSHNDTTAKIAQAIEEIREEIKNTPCEE